ncbi:MAG: PPOX class F420-dependent oxidoreductase [Candidatus Marinimicrobia bacterium]|nr:PPOX class F420-dependent oxidoreductase [Candidatus Neomarinimicrobiota bacterium]
MAAEISDGVRALLEGANIAHLATVMADGSPQVTAVWVDYDGKHILVNTAEGRQKPRNLRRDPRVALSIANQENAYAWAAIRGRVVELTPEGADEHIDKLGEDELKAVLRYIFGLKRKTKKLLLANPMEQLRERIQNLLYGDAPLAQRFTGFVEQTGGFDRPIVISLASELLHFTHPDRYWLWSPWIWEESKDGGALPLVIQAKAQISGGTVGEKYESVGKALQVVNALGHHRGFSDSGRGMFGTDIFMACVYAVYMYTVFKMKLSQEFNRILPELPEMTQRVLGVYQLEA